jgi:hypothetical protein
MPPGHRHRDRGQHHRHLHRPRVHRKREAARRGAAAAVGAPRERIRGVPVRALGGFRGWVVETRGAWGVPGPAAWFQGCSGCQARKLGAPASVAWRPTCSPELATIPPPPPNPSCCSASPGTSPTCEPSSSPSCRAARRPTACWSQTSPGSRRRGPGGGGVQRIAEGARGCRGGASGLRACQGACGQGGVAAARLTRRALSPPLHLPPCSSGAAAAAAPAGPKPDHPGDHGVASRASSMSRSIAVGGGRGWVGLGGWGGGGACICRRASRGRPVGRGGRGAGWDWGVGAGWVCRWGEDGVRRPHGAQGRGRRSWKAAAPNSVAPSMNVRAPHCIKASRHQSAAGMGWHSEPAGRREGSSVAAAWEQRGSGVAGSWGVRGARRPPRTAPGPGRRRLVWEGQGLGAPGPPPSTGFQCGRPGRGLQGAGHPAGPMARAAEAHFAIQDPGPAAAPRPSPPPPPRPPVTPPPPARRAPPAPRARAPPSRPPRRTELNAPD